MKKIFLFILILVSFKGFSQYPANQFIGTDSTLVTSRGALKSRLVNHVYTDTTQANTERIRQHPGAQIFTSSDNKLWVRNSSATTWVGAGITTETQTFQDVTDLGNSTTNGILVGSVSDITGTKFILQTDGSHGELILANSGNFMDAIRPQTASDGGDFRLPNTGNISDTIATLFDIRAGGYITTRDRFGKTGEDVSDTEDRTFNSSETGDFAFLVRDFDVFANNANGYAQLFRLAPHDVTADIHLTNNNNTTAEAGFTSIWSSVTDTVGEFTVFATRTTPSFSKGHANYGSYIRWTNRQILINPHPTGGKLKVTNLITADDTTNYKPLARRVSDSTVVQFDHWPSGGSGYTDEQAQDAVGAMINASLQYVDATPLLAIGDRDFGDITTTGSGLTMTIDDASVQINDIDATGTPDATTFLRGDGSWQSIAGGGNVSNTGTPLNNQLAIWTDATTIEGVSNLTFDGTTFIVTSNSQFTGGLESYIGNQNNVRLGRNALAAITTGTLNVAVGDGAGQNWTGDALVAIGYQAANASVSNTSITAVGYQAAKGITGNDNTAVGRSAMDRASSTGNENTAVGVFTLRGAAGLTGSGNSAFGSYAANALTTGAKNMAFGSSALFSLITGNDNVAVGWSAGRVITGSQNVIIGSSAGYTSTGTGNIFIGFEAGYSELGNYKLYIGWSAATPLIYGEFDNSILRITGQLQVTNLIRVTEIATPATPATGTAAIYPKADGLWYGIDDAGLETMLSNAGGAGEANTASNLGGGLANFDSKSVVDLRFNSFAAADFDLASNLITIDGTKWLTIAAGDAAYQPLDADLTTWAGITPGSNVGTFLATPSSANLISAVTDETGSGLLVFATSPTLTEPRLANGGFIADNNGNELIIFTTTASAVNELTYANAATGTNPKWTASGGDADVGIDWQVKGTGVYRFLSTSAGPAELRLFEDTDNGTNYTSFIAPAGLGSNVVVTLPSITGTLATLAGTETFTNKRVTPRTGTVASSATPTINTDNVDFFSITAQTVDITSFTTNLSGTPTDGQKLWIAITGTAARAITWGASFEASTVSLPTTTINSTRLDVGFVWNASTSKWRCVATQTLWFMLLLIPTIIMEIRRRKKSLFNQIIKAA